ncbi:MAG: hypothetical protein GWO81_06525 [Verrucomicrobia bacterium]|nr:hypothetical protein [Verrucomicrobiota bacterium]
MPKIDLDIVKRVLEQNNTDIQKLTAIIDDLKLQIQIEEEERANRPPPIKKQLVVLLADNDGTLAEQDITGWILQIPEDDSPVTASERIIRATHNYNATPKGRRLPVKTIGEACEVIGPKFMKEENVWVKTKTPVLAVATPNTIPTDNSE